MNNSRKTKLVSVVVPCLNEEYFIADCIASVLEFDLPERIQIEVLVLDGLSEDQTVIKLRSIMKKDAILINTSRGQIINQKDLENAIKGKMIGGAALDVTDPEPLPAESELLKMKESKYLIYQQMTAI